MMTPGLDAYAKRTPERTGIYAFERAALKFSPAFLKRFKANRAAWKYFQAQPPWYQRLMAFRIMSAKLPETRARRLEQTIAHSAAGEWIPGFPSPNREEERSDGVSRDPNSVLVTRTPLVAYDVWYQRRRVW